MLKREIIYILWLIALIAQQHPTHYNAIFLQLNTHTGNLKLPNSSFTKNLPTSTPVQRSREPSRWCKESGVPRGGGESKPVRGLYLGDTGLGQVCVLPQEPGPASGSAVGRCWGRWDTVQGSTNAEVLGGFHIRLTETYGRKRRTTSVSRLSRFLLSRPITRRRATWARRVLEGPGPSIFIEGKKTTLCLPVLYKSTCTAIVFKGK